MITATNVEKKPERTIPVLNTVPCIVVEGYQAIWLANLARYSRERVAGITANPVWKARIDALMTDIASAANESCIPSDGLGLDAYNEVIR